MGRGSGGEEGLVASLMKLEEDAKPRTRPCIISFHASARPMAD